MEPVYKIEDGPNTVAYARVIESPLDEQAGRNVRIIDMLIVTTPYRSRGHGTALLKTVCEAADAEKVTLRLMAEPFSDCPMSWRELRKFYRSYGFKSSKRNINRMTREPRS